MGLFGEEGGTAPQRLAAPVRWAARLLLRLLVRCPPRRAPWRTRPQTGPRGTETDRGQGQAGVSGGGQGEGAGESQGGWPWVWAGGGCTCRAAAGGAVPCGAHSRRCGRVSGGAFGIGCGDRTHRERPRHGDVLCCLAALLWAARQKTSEQASHGGGGPAALASVALRALRAPLSEPAFAKTGAHFPARCSAAASPSVLWCVCVCECGQ